VKSTGERFTTYSPSDPWLVDHRAVPRRHSRLPL
jgi:hypothetical protein